MRVVVGKIDGVRSVNVSLKEGLATIEFAPANRVTLARIREAIRSNGAMPRGAQVTVGGSLVPRGDTLTLAVPETGDVFVLEDPPNAIGTVARLRRQARSIQRIVVTGEVPPAAKRAHPSRHRMLVRSFTPAT